MHLQIPLKFLVNFENRQSVGFVGKCQLAGTEKERPQATTTDKPTKHSSETGELDIYLVQELHS